MIAIKKALYMTVPLLTAMTSCVQANDDTSSGTFTIGLGGHYTPRYSGSDKQVWQVVPVLQGRNGAFFIDTQKGVDMTCRTPAAGTSNIRWDTIWEGRIKTPAGGQGQII